MNEKRKLDEVYIDELLLRVVEGNYSALHLDVGRPPIVTGYNTTAVTELGEYENLLRYIIERMICDLLTDEQIAELAEESMLIFTYEAKGIARFGVFTARIPGEILATFQVMPFITGDSS